MNKPKLKNNYLFAGLALVVSGIIYGALTKNLILGFVFVSSGITFLILSGEEAKKK
jgi:hypothetical protein